MSNQLKIDPLPKVGDDPPGWMRLLNWLSLLQKTLSTNLYKDVSQLNAVPTSTTTTIFTIPLLTVTATWLVSCTLGVKNDTVNFSSFAVILSDGTAARIALSNNGAQMTLSISGLNVQCTQISGSTQNFVTSVTRIA